MRELTVELGAGSYPILIGAGLLGRAEPAARYAGAAAAVVTQPAAERYARPLAAALGAACRGVHVLPDGEEHKTLATLERLHGWLLEREFGRDGALLAVGGGVVGDLTGFAAATYMRGIGLVQAPTTLLAQVDAAVGGKTGVNHPLGKNMIGAFWQPRAVLIDPEVLASLPARQLRAGLAEVIKYGLLGDADFFAWLEAHAEAVLALEPAALAHAIETACACKARIVAADARERSGARALLNLGHTFAHAIETEQGYTQWLHGEAVACGLALAAELSARLGWLPAADAARVAALLERAGLPTRLPAELAPERLRAHMRRDKKNEGGATRLVLLRALGRAELTAAADETALRATLAGGR